MAKQDRTSWLKKHLHDTASSTNAFTQWSWVKRRRKPYTAHTTKLHNADGSTANLRDTATTGHRQGSHYSGKIKPVLKKTKNRKAPGPDHIPTEFCKMLDDTNIAKLADFFTQVLLTVAPPEQWDTVTVVEILKGKGDHGNPEMYRPISLLNTSYKIFTRIIQTRLAASLDNRLRSTQFGFRAHRSCLQPLYVLHRLQEMAQHKEGSFYMLFLDWAKAFDGISHAGLHSALAQLGVDTLYIRLIDALHQ
eukprot:gene710-478_t